MRLSEWRKAAPHRDSLTAKVEAAIGPVLGGFGADADPDCWILWGDDPATRWFLLVPTPAGLAEIGVRVNVPQEGPRASGKLVRWNRVQVGDFQVETQGGHRLLSFQIESQVLRAVDAECDPMAAFIRRVFAAIDGRSLPEPASARTPGARTPAGRAAATSSATTRTPARRTT